MCTMMTAILALVFSTCMICSTVQGVPVPGKRDISLTWSGDLDEGQHAPVGGYNEDTPMALDAPEYVRSLFANFTKETQSPTHFVQYNTIRSFENVANEDNCENNRYTVKFNISAIRRTELLHKSTLRVHLAINEGVSLPEKTVKVSLLFLNNTVINTADITVLSTSQWIEFGVTPALAWWMGNGGLINFQGFKIELSGTGLEACDKNVKIHTSNSGEFLSFLTVFTHETDKSQSTLSKTVAKMVEHVSELPDVNDVVKVTKRSTSTCSTVSSSISTNWMNENIFIYDDEHRKILYPESFAINKCGGQCDNKPSDSEHSSLLYLLKFSGHEDYVNDDLVLSCVPVKHKTISVLMEKGKGQGKVYLMEIIGQAVKTCGCIYSPPQPSNCDSS